MKTIRIAWVTGFAGLAVAPLLPPSMRLIFQAAAVLLCLVAWCAAICRAARAGEMGWVFLIALMPSIRMWFYVFRRRGVARAAADTIRPDAPSRPSRLRAVFSPLAVRQVLEVIREAERRFPEW